MVVDKLNTDLTFLMAGAPATGFILLDGGNKYDTCVKSQWDIQITSIPNTVNSVADIDWTRKFKYTGDNHVSIFKSIFKMLPHLVARADVSVPFVATSVPDPQVATMLVRIMLPIELSVISCLGMGRNSTGCKK